MWIVYAVFPIDRLEVRVRTFPMFAALFPSESCMMIPGTYAEMRADYD